MCQGGKISEVLDGHEDEDETFMKCLEVIRRVKGLAGIYVSTVNCLPVCCAVEHHVSSRECQAGYHVLIPMKAVSDSDLIPVTRSDAMPVVFGAQRRWRPYRA